MTAMQFAIGLIVGVLAGAAVGYLIRHQSSVRRAGTLEAKAASLLADAERDAETRRREALVEAKDEILQLRQGFEDEIKPRRTELERREERLDQRTRQIE